MQMQNEDFCIFNDLQNRLISQLTELHPGDAFLIQHHLRKLFPTLRTPTHPPYALMIHNAIERLEEAATKEAISEFIKREYHDLPWAHARILSVQLENLCEVGELVRAEGGRYVLRVDHDEEEKKQCDGCGDKRKSGNDVEEDIEAGQIEVCGKQSQDFRLHLETTYSSQPCDRPSESGLDAHRMNKEINPHDQAEDMVRSSHSNQKETVCSSHSNQKETSSSSQPAASNSSGQKWVVQSSEGSLESIVSTAIKSPPTQLQQQTSSNIDSSIVSKEKVSVTSEHVHDDQPQNFIQGSHKVNLGEDSLSRNSEQKPPKHPGVRPLNDDIRNEQRPNLNKIEKQHHYDRGRGRGRPCRVRGERLNQGRSQARPPKSNQNAKQCEEQLPQKDQVKLSDVGGRSHGRPPRPNQKTNQCEKLLAQDQCLEQKPLPVQRQARDHKPELGEVEPPAGLESRFGSGDVFQANYEAYKNQWKLIPVKRR